MSDSADFKDKLREVTLDFHAKIARDPLVLSRPEMCEAAAAAMYFLGRLEGLRFSAEQEENRSPETQKSPPAG